MLKNQAWEILCLPSELIRHETLSRKSKAKKFEECVAMQENASPLAKKFIEVLTGRENA